jgi:hypothetical protein
VRPAPTGGDATLRSVRARLTLIALVLAAGATASACGGGGDDRLSQDEFRQQANAICAKYDARIKALGSPSSPGDIPDFVQQGIPLLRQGIAELRALKPPAELQDDFDRMLNETAKAIPAAQSLAAAAEKADAAGVQKAIAQAQAASAASDRLATDLQLDQCAAS